MFIRFINTHVRRVGAKVATAGFVALFFSPAIAFGPIVSPQELKPLIDTGGVRVLDIREIKGTPDAPAYDQGHIPGSVSTPYSQFRGEKSNPGRPVSAEKLSSLLSAAGISPDTKIVITNRGTDATDFGAAARVYWTLKVAGLKNLAILDGGLQGWTNAGNPLVTVKPVIKPTSISVTYNEAEIVTPEEVSQAIRASGSSKPRLIDARPAAFFKGETRHDAAARYGTLPGAENISHDLWFLPKTGVLKTKLDIHALAKASGLIQDQETVSFCNTGHWAATNWFILSEVLQQGGAKMYPESIVGWSKGSLPMDNEPSRVGALWRDLKRAF
jgi:thiosulfate/3-mercaptopyruvate sulfurtransferase